MPFQKGVNVWESKQEVVKGVSFSEKENESGQSLLCFPSGQYIMQTSPDTSLDEL